MPYSRLHKASQAVYGATVEAGDRTEGNEQSDDQGSIATLKLESEKRSVMFRLLDRLKLRLRELATAGSLPLKQATQAKEERHFWRAFRAGEFDPDGAREAQLQAAKA